MTAHRSTELIQLQAALDSKRQHILEIINGLDDEQLRIAALPSGWTPLELLRHLTLGDERYWFSSIIGGEDLDWVPTGPRADWHVGPDDTAASIIDAYREQIAASNMALDGVDPDEPPQRRDSLWDTWGIDFPNVRVIVLHMIVETATHAGHLDAVVELIDGRQHLVLD
jgi:Protein of unknown function (DUF664)